MKKKLLAVLLAVSMLAGTGLAVPGNLTVQAEENETVDAVGEDLAYLYLFSWEMQEDGTLEITGYTGDGTEVNIPSEINGKKVTSIGRDAFRYCYSLTSINIPDTVTSIDDFAFNNCSNLTSISIPGSVTSIGYAAFKECSSLTSISIPDSVTSISEYAFEDCSSLTSISIPDSVTSIGDFAFYKCSSLTSISIPGSVTSIGHVAFSGCSSLASISIPDSVMSIGGYAFSGCNSLTSISIPESVTSIGNAAFSGCSSLTSINIPDSVTSIGINAFRNTPCFANREIYIRSVTNNTDKKDENSNADQTPDTGTNPSPDSPQDTGNNTFTGQTTVSLSTLTLSANSFNCTGKAHTPSVTVTDVNGQSVPSSGYTISYTNNKNVGQATVTVTGSGNYTGTVSATFTILPKGTNLSKVTAKKKSFTVKWKKQAVQTTGYQIQYSTNAKFKGAKTLTVKKNKTVSATAKKLKAKQKYYVRVRTYKTIKINGKSTKLYSGWSKTKTVKVK